MKNGNAFESGIFHHPVEDFLIFMATNPPTMTTSNIRSHLGYTVFMTPCTLTSGTMASRFAQIMKTIMKTLPLVFTPYFASPISVRKEMPNIMRVQYTIGVEKKSVPCFIASPVSVVGIELATPVVVIEQAPSPQP